MEIVLRAIVMFLFLWVITRAVGRSTLYLTFTAPDAETFVVDYDAYIQPSAQRGSSARVSVVDGTTPLVSVDLHTRLLP